MSSEQSGQGSSGPLLALDVDGVLLDPERGGLGSWQVAFGTRFGVDPAGLDDTLFSASWAEVIVGRRPVESALADAIGQLGWDMQVEAALACWFEEDFRVDPAVIAAVTVWSQDRARLALVSNQEPRRARFLEQRLAELLPLHGTAFSGDLGAVKSDPDFYVRAERHLGLTGTQSVVFLDDTAANVDVARRHGWTSIHFTRGGPWQREVAAALAESTDEDGGTVP